MPLDTYFFYLPVTSAALALAAYRAVHDGPGLTVDVLTLLGVASLTHGALYPLIWFQPATWALWCGGGGERAVACFRYAVALHKVLFAAALYARGWLAPMLAACPLRVDNAPLACGLLSVGAWLQYHVYAQLGADGVYYGFKLGRPVPWCKAFPFHSLRHPQYVSASCIMLGVLMLCEWRPYESTLLFAGQVIISSLEPLGY